MEGKDDHSIRWDCSRGLEAEMQLLANLSEECRGDTSYAERR